MKLVTITICTARPGLVIGKGGQDVDKLKEELKNLFKKEIQINEINVRKIYETLVKELNEELKLENKDKKQIINYNCLTGEPINIENHSSGENKWIAKKDIKKLEIEKKINVKEKIGKNSCNDDEKEMEDYKRIEVWKQKKLLILQMKKSYTLYQYLIIIFQI